MKLVCYLLLALTLSPAAFAANKMRCMATPIQADDLYGYNILPMIQPAIFDYEIGTEKIVPLAIRTNKFTSDGSEEATYEYVISEKPEDTVLTVEFSRKSIDGKLLPPGQFSFYLRANTDGANPAWSMANPNGIADMRPVDFSEKDKGFMTLNCVRL